VLTTATAGVPVNGPAFIAVKTSAQSVSSYTSTKLAFETELYDTSACFNNTGSTVGGIPAYAFLPNVAGYYQVNGTVVVATSTAGNLAICQIYKNGAQYISGTSGATGNSFFINANVAALVYMNGTTDYLELYVYTSFAAALAVDTAARNQFSAAMVRSAT
jgi:hypothetical protein